MQRYRVITREGEADEWGQAIAAECQGWPQHLHVYLQALARGLIRNGADGALARVHGSEVWDGAQEERVQYYEERLAHPVLEDCRSLVASALTEMTPDRAWTRAWLGRVTQEVSNRLGAKDPDYQLPAGMSGKDFVERMIRAGVLHKGQKGVLHVPIPAFVQYLQDAYLTPEQKDRKVSSHGFFNPEPG